MKENGFFQASEVLEKPSVSSSIPQCGACGIYKICTSPKMPVAGQGRLGILVVGEAPGKVEDDEGVPFVGPAGQVLRTALSRCGVDLDRDCWATNALICRPSKNRKPTSQEIEYCRPNLTKTIQELSPRLIIPLGGSAVAAVLSPVWRENIKAVGNWVGWHIPLQKWNCWVTPTYHPSFVNRSKDEKSGKVIKLWFRRHLKQAIELEGRPWDDVPDYLSQIEVIEDPTEAADRVRRITKASDPCSWDLETNRLKPDPRNSRIASVSICRRGLETISYPFIGEAVKATEEFIKSPLPKIGYNTKFEDRWCLKMFGCQAENWVWDGMLSAHHLDNRKGICSVEFQALVRLGVEPWSYNITRFLKDSGEDGLNKVFDIRPHDLLLYGGLDSLIEYHIAVKQKQELKKGGY